MRRDSYLIPIIIFCAGAFLALSVWWMTEGWEREDIQAQLNHQGALHTAAIQRELKLDIGVLVGLRGLFNASDKVTRAEFAIYTRPIATRHPSIQALEWIPRVSHAFREAMEASAQLDDLKGFGFTERGAGSRMVKAAVRDEYFPVYYVEPMAGNEKVLGFNLASSAIRRVTLEAARDSGKILATASINLLQTKEKQKGLLLLAPVYRWPPATLRQHRQALMGFTLGVLRLSSLMERAQEHFGESNDIYLELFDITAPKPEQLYASAGETPQAGSNVFKAQEEFEVAGRRWRAIYRSSPAFEQAHQRVLPLFLGIVGLLLSALGALYARTLLIREARVQTLVAQRTDELEGSRSRVTAILKTAVTAIITIDTHGNVRLFNPAAERMFGYSAAEVAGQNVKMLMPEPYQSEHDGYLHAYHTTRRPRIIGMGREVEARRKDGSVFPIHLAVGEAETDDAPFFVGMITDITAQKAAEQALLESKQKAEEANRQKSDFVNMISHELRTPLTVLLGYLPLLQDERMMPDKAMVAQIAIDMDASGTHLLELINDLLDISKIESGKMELRRQRVGVEEALDTVVTQLRPKAEAKGLTLQREGECPAASANADPFRLQQILINLVGNAIKFTDSGHITVSCACEDQALLFHVSDSGKGIPAAELPHIFERFQQVDNSSTREQGGSGLGLAITRQLVELHGGEVRAQSTPGAGSRFSFTLPRWEDDDGEDTAG